jgi:hypothetical protein
MYEKDDVADDASVTGGLAVPVQYGASPPDSSWLVLYKVCCAAVVTISTTID